MAIPPKPGTEAYRWWAAGAEAEAASRREGLTSRQIDILAVLESLFAMRSDQEPVEALATTGFIYSGSLTLWERLRIARRFLRGS